MTEEQRDSLLIEMSENIKTINNVLGKHSEILESHSEILESHSKMLKEHSNELVNLRKNMLRIEREFTERIDEHSKELVRLRENMARMEHELTDKIMALFDLGEVNKDKFEETDIRINETQNTLDWHNRRIMKLEMAD